jgi:hypothetical protein
MRLYLQAIVDLALTMSTMILLYVALTTIIP